MSAAAIEVTCALCGSNPASQRTDWDGRIVPACGPCLAPPVGQRNEHDRIGRVLATRWKMLRRPGPSGSQWVAACLECGAETSARWDKFREGLWCMHCMRVRK